MKKKYIILGITLLIITIITITYFLIFKVNITKNEALEKAYKYLGKTETDFSYKKIERDISDNSYEIKLNDGEYNYEIEINVKSGEIINYEKEPITNINTPVQEKYIKEAEAKAKALEHSNLKEEEVIFTKIKMELDDNIMIYEIEFIQNNKEYEYKIDATNGNIIKYETSGR